MPHIPSSGTQSHLIPPFREELASALRPSDVYDAERWLYVPNHYTDYRYILGTLGRRPLICVGINPSTAGPDAPDRTLQSVERIAHTNGHDSLLMCNVYAQRATSPQHMEMEGNRWLHEQNLEAFTYALSLSDRPAVWAAWGTNIDKRPYLRPGLRELAELADTHEARWYRAGPLTRHGHPRHPLYLPRTTVLEPFDLVSYLA